MTLYCRRSLLMRAFQRVVATLAVVGLLSTTGFDCIHHTAHAGDHEAGTTQQTMMSHIVIANHDASHQTNDCAPHALDIDPVSPSHHGDESSDCTHCGAAHCFAGVMPTNASISAPWMISKKGVTLDSFAEPPPTWRLERPPKTVL